MSILGAIGLGTNIIGGILGLGSDRARNRRSREELALQRDLANNQIDIANYIRGISEDVVDRGSNITDPYGNVTGYDAESGTYRAPLRPTEIAVQDASDQEELQRYTVDQELRRRALQDIEGNRSQASGEADQSQRDISLFRQGVGAIDPTQLASSIRLNREQAINAGFDDAERAATTLSLRTGSSSVQDALGNIGRQRARARLEGIGNPEVEGLQLADELNRSRLGQRVGLYDMYSGQANTMPDVGYVPSANADRSFDRATTAQQLDLNRYNTAMGGSGTAAAAIGSAASGARQAFATTEANRVHAPTAQFVSGLGSALGKLDLGSIFGR